MGRQSTAAGTARRRLVRGSELYGGRGWARYRPHARQAGLTDDHWDRIAELLPFWDGLVGPPSIVHCQLFKGSLTGR